MEAAWETAYQAIGVGHRDMSQSQASREHRSAGLGTAAAAYHSAANDYPRFERQIIRTVQDDGVATGSRQPHPELLRRYPNREHRQQHRPGTWRSASSGRSARSSSSSHRSATSLAGSSIAAVSTTSSSSRPPPSGYCRQAPARPPFVYQTSSSQIGAGGHAPSEPLPGREVWMLGRGGGQQTSYDSCLVRK